MRRLFPPGPRTSNVMGTTRAGLGDRPAGGGHVTANVMMNMLGFDGARGATG